MNPLNSNRTESQQKRWDRTRYAFHEAGHAVVGHVIGRCISEVSIVADSTRGYHGYCIFNAYTEDVQGLPQWREGSQNPDCPTIMYGGIISMAMLCEQRSWKYEHWRGCDRADFNMIYLWSFERFGKDEDQARAMQHAGNGRARFSFSWELLDNYPRATFPVLDRAGHFVNIEQDVLCQALMREWLDRVEECATDLDPPRVS
jgi:hypothetical protein